MSSIQIHQEFVQLLNVRLKRQNDNRVPNLNFSGTVSMCSTSEGLHIRAMVHTLVSLQTGKLASSTLYQELSFNEESTETCRYSFSSFLIPETRNVLF